MACTTDPGTNTVHPNLVTDILNNKPQWIEIGEPATAEPDPNNPLSDASIDPSGNLNLNVSGVSNRVPATLWAYLKAFIDVFLEQHSACGEHDWSTLLDQIDNIRDENVASDADIAESKLALCFRINSKPRPFDNGTYGDTCDMADDILQLYERLLLNESSQATEAARPERILKAFNWSGWLAPHHTLSDEELPADDNDALQQRGVGYVYPLGSIDPLAEADPFNRVMVDGTIYVPGAGDGTPGALTDSTANKMFFRGKTALDLHVHGFLLALEQNVSLENRMIFELPAPPDLAKDGRQDLVGIECWKERVDLRNGANDVIFPYGNVFYDPYSQEDSLDGVQLFRGDDDPDYPAIGSNPAYPAYLNVPAGGYGVPGTGSHGKYWKCRDASGSLEPLRNILANPLHNVVLMPDGTLYQFRWRQVVFQGHDPDNWSGKSTLDTGGTTPIYFRPQGQLATRPAAGLVDGEEGIFVRQNADKDNAGISNVVNDPGVFLSVVRGNDGLPVTGENQASFEFEGETLPIQIDDQYSGNVQITTLTSDATTEPFADVTISIDTSNMVDPGLAVGDLINVEVRYRESGTIPWTTISAAVTYQVSSTVILVIPNLNGNLCYEVQVQIDNGLGNPADFPIQWTSPGAELCGTITFVPGPLEDASLDGNVWFMPVALVHRRNTQPWLKSNANGGLLIGSGNPSDRPDGLYSDIVAVRDVLDTRNRIYPDNVDYRELLQETCQLLYTGQLRTEWKENRYTTDGCQTTEASAIYGTKHLRIETLSGDGPNANYTDIDPEAIQAITDNESDTGVSIQFDGYRNYYSDIPGEQLVTVRIPREDQDYTENILNFDSDLDAQQQKNLSIQISALNSYESLGLNDPKQEFITRFSSKVPQAYWQDGTRANVVFAPYDSDQLVINGSLQQGTPFVLSISGSATPTTIDQYSSQALGPVGTDITDTSVILDDPPVYDVNGGPFQVTITGLQYSDTVSPPANTVPAVGDGVLRLELTAIDPGAYELIRDEFGLSNDVTLNHSTGSGPATIELPASPFNPGGTGTLEAGFKFLEPVSIFKIGSLPPSQVAWYNVIYVGEGWNWHGGESLNIYTSFQFKQGNGWLEKPVSWSGDLDIWDNNDFSGLLRTEFYTRVDNLSENGFRQVLPGDGQGWIPFGTCLDQQNRGSMPDLPTKSLGWAGAIHKQRALGPDISGDGTVPQDGVVIDGTTFIRMSDPCVIKEDNGTYRAYFAAREATGNISSIITATSPDGIDWTADPTIVIEGGQGDQALGAFAPWVIKRGGTYEMTYTAMPSNQDNAKIVWASSVDGVSFTGGSNPIADGQDYPAGIIPLNGSFIYDPDAANPYKFWYVKMDRNTGLNFLVTNEAADLDSFDFNNEENCALRLWNTYSHEFGGFDENVPISDYLFRPCVIKETAAGETPVYRMWMGIWFSNSPFSLGISGTSRANRDFTFELDRTVPFAVSDTFTITAVNSNLPNVAAINGPVTADVTFTGSATGYQVRYRPIGDVAWTNVISAVFDATLTGLSITTCYEVQIREGINDPWVDVGKLCYQFSGTYEADYRTSNIYYMTSGDGQHFIGGTPVIGPYWGKTKNHYVGSACVIKDGPAARFWHTGYQVQQSLFNTWFNINDWNAHDDWDLPAPLFSEVGQGAFFFRDTSDLHLSGSESSTTGTYPSIGTMNFAPGIDDISFVHYETKADQVDYGRWDTPTSSSPNLYYRIKHLDDDGIVTSMGTGHIHELLDDQFNVRNSYYLDFFGLESIAVDGRENGIYSLAESQYNFYRSFVFHFWDNNTFWLDCGRIDVDFKTPEITRKIRALDGNMLDRTPAWNSWRSGIRAFYHGPFEPKANDLIRDTFSRNIVDQTDSKRFYREQNGNLFPKTIFGKGFVSVNKPTDIWGFFFQPAVGQFRSELFLAAVAGLTDPESPDYNVRDGALINLVGRPLTK